MEQNFLINILEMQCKILHLNPKVSFFLCFVYASCHSSSHATTNYSCERLLVSNLSEHDVQWKFQDFAMICKGSL